MDDFEISPCDKREAGKPIFNLSALQAALMQGVSIFDACKAQGLTVKKLIAMARYNPTLKTIYEHTIGSMTADVKLALHKRAVGFKEEVEGKEVYFAPDTHAAIGWLKTYARDEWDRKDEKDAKEVIADVITQIDVNAKKLLEENKQ